MGTILNTVAKIKFVIDIIFSDLQDDGTVIKIIKNIEYDKEYEFIVYNRRQQTTWTVRGRLKDYGCDPCNRRKNEIQYIIVDTSTDKHSRTIRLRIDSIKAINEIENLS